MPLIADRNIKDFDIIDDAEDTIENFGSLIADPPPVQSGFSTRQARLPNNRAGRSVRKLMHWLVPGQPIVQMYINPQNVTYGYKKIISSQRTKGGFMLQYWGEDLISLRISGTTGTSGIEGINVLNDVYRNEQLALDPYALLAASQQERTSFEEIGSNLGNFLGPVGESLGSIVGSLLQLGNSAANSNTLIIPKPTLAELAFSVELYWSGEVYRGFFNNFSVTEAVGKLGMFDYDIDFNATQKRGFRQNFLAWHRSATSGPSNSDPEFGTPYSFNATPRR